MKSKLQHSPYELTTKPPSVLILAHSYQKSIIVLLVIALHLIGLWFLSHFIEPYTLATSPKVNALKVRFVSLVPSENPTPHTTAQRAIAQPPKQQYLKKQSAPRATQQSAEIIEQKIFTSQNATNTVQKKQPSQKHHSFASQLTQTVAVQSVESKAFKQQTQTDQQSTVLNENQQMHKAQSEENQ